MRIGFIIYGTLDALSGGYLYDRVVVQGLTRLGLQELGLAALATYNGRPGW